MFEQEREGERMWIHLSGIMHSFIYSFSDHCKLPTHAGPGVDVGGAE